MTPQEAMLYKGWREFYTPALSRLLARTGYPASKYHEAPPECKAVLIRWIEACARKNAIKIFSEKFIEGDASDHRPECR